MTRRAAHERSIFCACRTRRWSSCCAPSPSSPSQRYSTWCAGRKRGTRRHCCASWILYLFHIRFQIRIRIWLRLLKKDKNKIKNLFKNKITKVSNVIWSVFFFLGLNIKNVQCLSSVLRIRGVYPGYRVRIFPFRIQGQKDSGSTSKNVSIFNPKNCF